MDISKGKQKPIASTTMWHAVINHCSDRPFSGILLVKTIQVIKSVCSLLSVVRAAVHCHFQNLFMVSTASIVVLCFISFPELGKSPGIAAVQMYGVSFYRRDIPWNFIEISQWRNIWHFRKNLCLISLAELSHDNKVPRKQHLGGAQVILRLSSLKGHDSHFIKMYTSLQCG